MFRAISCNFLQFLAPFCTLDFYKSASVQITAVWRSRESLILKKGQLVLSKTQPNTCSRDKGDRLGQIADTRSKAANPDVAL